MISVPFRINFYLFLMLIAVCFSTFVTESIVVVWIVNLAGLILIFLPYFKSANVSLLFASFTYIFFGILTFWVNLDYLSDDLKSIGTNVNIFVPPMLLYIAYSIKRKNVLDTKCILLILKFLSILGTISVAIAWIIGASDILQVFAGMNAYQANVSGIFYSKNIYGAFIGLTMAADLYMLSDTRSIKSFILLGIKFLAVILSFSRAALLQAVIMIFVFYWLKNKRKARDYIILFAGLLIALIFVFIILLDSNLTDFFMNSVFRVEAGDAGRAMLYERAISQLPDNIINVILGVGFAGIDSLNMDVDNTYLYLWFTGGFPKIFFYSGAAIFSIYNILKLKKKDMVLYRICFAVYVSYFFFAFFESVAFLELGLLNFIYTFFMFFIPIGYYKKIES